MGTVGLVGTLAMLRSTIPMAGLEEKPARAVLRVVPAVAVDRPESAAHAVWVEQVVWQEQLSKAAMNPDRVVTNPMGAAGLMFTVEQVVPVVKGHAPPSTLERSTESL